MGGPSGARRRVPAPGRPLRWMATPPRKGRTESRLQAGSPSLPMVHWGNGISQPTIPNLSLRIKGILMSGTMRERSSKAHKTGRWELRAYAGRDPETGKPRQVSRVFIGGKRDAAKALDRLVAEVDARRHTGTGATFGKLLDLWLAKVEDLGRTQSTLESYRIHVRKHIRPALGDVRLDKLTAHKLDEYFQSLSAKGLAPATVKLDHAVVSAALSLGVDYEWLPSNPAKTIRLRDPDRRPVAGLTVDQLRTLYFGKDDKNGKHLKGALEEDPDVAVVIALAALTGCRRGELCGLKWSDVDWDRQCIKVERALLPVTGGQVEGKTKTGKARTVFLGEDGMSILRRYWDEKRGLPVSY